MAILISVYISESRAKLHGFVFVGVQNKITFVSLSAAATIFFGDAKSKTLPG